ncbi:MAG: hypothetical protein R3F07_05320 [Opitutaceae bacterium]
MTDQGWKAWGGKIGGWESHDYDDGAWPAAIDLGGSGDQPWGLVHSPDMNLHGPQSAGIEGELRVTYVPHAGPIIQRNLGALSSWHFSRFDPATGHEERVGPIVADADGNWCCPPPVRGDHDWIVLLERVQDPADQRG